MTKRIVLIGVGLLILYYLLTFTSVDRKYEILNEVLKDNGFHLDTVCNEFDHVTFFDDNLVDFSIWDQVAVHTQKVINRFYTMRPGAIEHIPRTGTKSSAAILFADCDNDHKFLYHVSLPIVSSDEGTVLIKIIEDCNCNLGGQGGEYLLKRIEGKWRIVNQFNRWIS
jgi:hypothetical protein